MKFLWGTALCFFLVSAHAETAKLSASRFFRTADNAKVELIFDQALNEKTKITTNFINNTIEVNLAEIDTDLSKESKQINDERIERLYIYQPQPGLVRSRIIYKKSFAAKNLEGKVETMISGEKVTIVVYDGDTAIVESAPVVPPVSVDEEAAVEEEVSESQLVAASESLNLPENKIPVLTAPAPKAEAPAANWGRLLLSLLIVIVVGIALAWVTRRWSKLKNPIGSKQQIKILTQHHLGPKRSLAIIQVAGESILIGITEHNISLIKPLALLEEELPESVPQNFAESLNERETMAALEETDEAESFAFGGIKDRVRNKLKGLRSL